MALYTLMSQAPRQKAIRLQGSGGGKEHCTPFPGLEKAEQITCPVPYKAAE